MQIPAFLGEGIFHGHRDGRDHLCYHPWAAGLIYVLALGAAALSFALRGRHLPAGTQEAK